MKILVTGSAGFVGKNLVENLKNIRDGKNLTRPDIHIDTIYEYDVDSERKDLDRFCADCDFVFNLAGVNRPKDPEEFKKGNFGFASVLLDTLKKHGNRCPVMLSSSVQAALTGRFKDSEYGKSKKDGEELFFDYGKETGANVLVYRFPNLLGKWIRPNYNSAVGTFCYNIANDLPITINDKNTELEMVFIDDLIEEMYDALSGKEHHCDFDGTSPVFKENGKYCAVPVSYRETLGRIAELLYTFHDQPETLFMPAIPEGSFEKKLYSMYVSYLPKEKMKQTLISHPDERGCFTELMKTASSGQFSVNVINPGFTKGQHWHNTKFEIFYAVSGHGIIQIRKIGTDEVTEFEVSGEKPEAVYMVPGYTHNIKNTSDSENLVALIWVNEIFDKDHPDTFREEV